jgi:hypothetical protein
MSEGPEARPSLVGMMQEGLGRIIGEAKNQIVKELASLKGKYQKEAEPEDDAGEILRGSA